MKKFVGIILTVLLMVGSVGTFGGCADRSKFLKLYSQGEYMDESIFPEFEAWYLEETGKKITVTMDDFNSNEQMYTTISRDEEDFDLICPSDYMIEKMINNNLLLKTEVDIAEFIHPTYLQIAKTADPNLDYMVPYMFGTFGILYNYKTTEKHLDSYDSIFGNEFYKKITTKRSIRDSFSAAQIYSSVDQLKAIAGNDFALNDTQAYKDAIQNIFNDTKTQTVDAAVAALSAQKKNLAYYDDENGKFDMAQDKMTAGLYWSCDAGYVMSDYENDNGDIEPGNKDLWYVIPKEGANVYVDGFVISKHAGNVDAARYFLKFLCQKEIAKRNSIAAGAVSTVKAAYDELFEEFMAMPISGDEESVFNDTSVEWKNMYIDMMFPSEREGSDNVLMRCGVMRDYKAAEGEIIRRVSDIMT